MYSFSVTLGSIADVKRFVDAASHCPCEVDVLSGRYLVDAKSIMGLFSLDLAHPVNVEFHGAEEAYRSFLKKIEPSVVKD